jgi:hypothetical protein
MVCHLAARYDESLMRILLYALAVLLLVGYYRGSLAGPSITPDTQKARNDDQPVSGVDGGTSRDYGRATPASDM